MSTLNVVMPARDPGLALDSFAVSPTLMEDCRVPNKCLLQNILRLAPQPALCNLVPVKQGQAANVVLLKHSLQIKALIRISR
jgi:hypothetical protein